MIVFVYNLFLLLEKRLKINSVGNFPEMKEKDYVY